MLRKNRQILKLTVFRLKASKIRMEYFCAVCGPYFYSFTMWAVVKNKGKCILKSSHSIYIFCRTPLPCIDNDICLACRHNETNVNQKQVIRSSQTRAHGGDEEMWTLKLEHFAKRGAMSLEAVCEVDNGLLLLS